MLPPIVSVWQGLQLQLHDIEVMHGASLIEDHTSLSPTIDLPVGSAVGTSGSCAVMSSSPVPSGLAPTSGNSPWTNE